MKLFEDIIRFILIALEEIFKAFAEILLAILGTLPDNSASYNAEFVGSGQVLSRFNRGFCLDGYRSLSTDHSTRNALVIGGTGTGKSTSVIIPSVFKGKTHSMVIHDPSGEIYQNTAGYLRSNGYQIKVLNFSNPQKSIRFNPLQRIETSADINKIASMIIRNTLGTGTKGDPFWNLQATGLLALLIAILKEQDEQYQNLANLKHLITQFASDSESLDQLFINAQDESTFNEYRAYVSMDPKLLSNITATCKSSLTHLSDEAILQVTSTDELNIESFRSRKTALFISNSVIDSYYYSTLTAILLEQFFSVLLKDLPDTNDLHTLFLIDELPTLFMPTLSTAIANVRKYKAGIMCICQDFNQLAEKYGHHDAQTIRSNCFAQVYFPGQNLQTAKELEIILGKYQHEDKNGKTTIRPLMTSDEIRILDNNRALLICSNYRPMKLRMRPFYRRLKYRCYTKLPNPSIARPNQRPKAIPLINLSTKQNDHE